MTALDWSKRDVIQHESAFYAGAVAFSTALLGTAGDQEALKDLIDALKKDVAYHTHKETLGRIKHGDLR